MKIENGKKIRYGILLLGCAALISGCGSKDVAVMNDKDVITIGSDGSVSRSFRVDFSKDYYSAEELAGMMTEEFSSYNANCGEDAFTLVKCEREGNELLVTICFGNYSYYEEYTGEALFVGNIQEAYDAQNNFNQVLLKAGTEDTFIGKNDLMNMADHRVVIYEGDYQLQVPTAVSYYTMGMTLEGKDTVSAEESGVYMVLY